MIGDRLFKRFPTVMLARKHLFGSPVRTGLAALGIVIGVVAITALGMFGSAFLRAQLGTVEDLGTQVQVSPAYEEGRFALREQDVVRIRRTVGAGTSVTPVKRGFVRLSTSRKTESVTRMGVSNPRELVDVKSGRIPNNWRRGVLVGPAVAREMDLQPGDHVDVNYRLSRTENVSRSTRVLGVLERKERTSVLRVRNAIVMPVSTFEHPTYDQVVLRADSVERAKRDAAAIRDRFNGRRKRVRVREGARIQRRIEKIKRQINTFLLGIGAISLVVAGVSILNVMLMSVMERKEQLAVLRAVGYQRTAVLRTVLAEALFLGVVGSVVGLGASALVGMAINDALLGNPYAFAPASARYAALGAGFGVGVSVVGGIYPAWKAARADPVEELRG